MPGAVMGAEDTKMSNPLSGRSHWTSRDRCTYIGGYSVGIAEMGRDIM